MEKLIINSYEEFEAHLGQELGTSEWVTVDQDRINKFADATLDDQWIHVDVERAKAESPYKSTIAHTGNSVRLVTTLQSITNLRGTCKAEIKFRIEIKETGKKALEGIATFLYYFND